MYIQHLDSWVIDFLDLLMYEYEGYNTLVDVLHWTVRWPVALHARLNHHWRDCGSDSIRFNHHYDIIWYDSLSFIIITSTMLNKPDAYIECLSAVGVPSIRSSYPMWFLRGLPKHWLDFLESRPKSKVERDSHRNPLPLWSRTWNGYYPHHRMTLPPRATLLAHNIHRKFIVVAPSFGVHAE